MTHRIEHDALGEVRVPVDAWWGAQTQRALANFPISGLTVHPQLLRAMVLVKKAAAESNASLGGIPPKTGAAIVAACDTVLAGGYATEFPVDVFQMGAGTAFHMNVNEVLANLANVSLGGGRGVYDRCHPNDHVNRGQSTNDCFPTAMRIAAATLAQGLDRQLDLLARALEGRAEAFAGVVKTGRTHLMDAAPVTLGQEVAAWGATVEALRGDLRRAADAMCEVGLGGTAVGTGLNAVRGFREAAVARLAELTGLPLRPAADLREAMQSQRCVGTMSSAMRAIALELVRICNDLRLLASGPACGLGELRLPEVAPGSSIMPGKVNPSIPEMVTQVMFLVAGLDGANALALQAGQLELNVFMPLMAFDLDFGLAIMTNAVEVLRERCVAGLEADEAACGRHLAAGGAIATALTPAIGYEKAAELTREALATGTPVRTLVVERGFMEAAEVDHLLDTRRLVGPGSPERS